MQDFRNLKVWQKSHRLVLEVYTLTRSFPSDERYGVTSQLRRSASSIPANLAEGCGRSSKADFARFVTIASGSASESEYHLLLAHDLGYLSDEDHSRLGALVVEVKRMLSSLEKRIRSQASSQSTEN